MNATSIRALDDSELVSATLAGDEGARREVLRRYSPALRAAIRDLDGALTAVRVNVLIDDFWLWLLANGARRLGSFDATRGAALLSWLTVRLSQFVCEASPPHPAAEEPMLMSVEEVAKRWGIHKQTVYSMLERGQLASRRCGRLIRIPRKAVESFELQIGLPAEGG